ncbi:protein inturned [Trichonephila clavata]|uniref:Protein inturned n=1 Tax=Trichonephila clavata TaxID=2740835 RepID=A0A8X6HSI3_TRICU|nr:protein inturned [Trichonephila clavata]
MFYSFFPSVKHFLEKKEIIKLSTLTKYGVNTFLRNAYEQGVLFRYTPKDNAKQKISMTFWVVGRLFFLAGTSRTLCLLP